jgi:hypothetical protein
MKNNKRLRCAIYTRKSTTEGLEQDFNSLDAQRVFCEPIYKAKPMKAGYCCLNTMMMAVFLAHQWKDRPSSC